MKVFNNFRKNVYGEATSTDSGYEVSYEWTDAAGELHQGLDTYDDIQGLHEDWTEVEE